MSIIDHFKDDMASISNTHERQAARRYWLRAVIETLHERALTTMPLPARRLPKGEKIISIVSVEIRGKVVTVSFDDALTTVRCEPNWHLVTDDDLYTLKAYIEPFFKRKENRGQTI